MAGKVVAFVQAKGTSERVPSKNKQILGDRPLFGHAIRNAKNAKLVDEVVIDSEDEEILKTGEIYGATPLKRPIELASNKSEGNAMMTWAASQRPDAEIIMQVMSTSPFIKSSTIDRSINMIKNLGINSVVSVYKQVLYVWKEGSPTHLLPDGRVPNSRFVKPTIYETTGLYVIKTESVKINKWRTDPNSCGFVEVSIIEAIDIDTPDELEFARIVYRGLKNESN